MIRSHTRKQRYIMDDELKDELEELSPLLGKMRKKSKERFSTPPLYFEQLEEEAWKKIKASAQQDTTTTAPEKGAALPRLSWWERLRGWILKPSYGLGLAAMATIVVAAVFLLRSPQGSRTQQSYEDLLAQISDDELYGYVQENEEDFDAELLIETMQESDLQAIPSPIEVLGDTTIVPQNNTSSITANTNNNTTSQNTTNDNTQQEPVSVEKMLEGITADDILEFLNEEGMMEDILDEVE